MLAERSWKKLINIPKAILIRLWQSGLKIKQEALHLVYLLTCQTNL
jgi:hypothetical protein